MHADGEDTATLDGEDRVMSTQHSRLLMRLSVQAGAVDGGTVVRVEGELDRATVPTLEETLRALQGHVMIDARDLTFLDAHALGVLVEANNRTGVSVQHASPFCRRIFELCGLETLLDDGR
jgi:anti-anti-sigma factor